MKERLDLLLVEKKLAPSREKAKTLIMEGCVYVDHQKEDKPGQTFPKEACIEVRTNPNPYVSRGGLKLAKAFDTFHLDVRDQICTDVGASTGGFTDCMLQNGAKKVYAIDVGKGQLSWKLRTDPRVVVMEKTNIRYVTPEMIGEPIDFSSVDVSFISLTKVLIPIRAYLKPGAQVVTLIKPQFEAGREKVGKKGVVREAATHRDVITQIVAFASQNGFSVEDLTFSPIRGPEGNIEYLLLLDKEEGPAAVSSRVQIADTVSAAFLELSQRA